MQGIGPTFMLTVLLYQVQGIGPTFMLTVLLYQVQGIGPTFKLTVNLQNTSLTQASSNLIIAFEYDDRLYSFRKKFIQVGVQCWVNSASLLPAPCFLD